MQIKIVERLLPFSHQSGTFCLIPYTTWEVQVFPTRLYFRNLRGLKEDFALTLSCKGPIKQFTVQQDLEHGYVRIFGHTQEGYMEYLIDKGALYFKKLPLTGIVCGTETVHKGMSYALPLHAEPVHNTKERLSLGMHRSQDWELVKRRMDLREIFPIWLKLAAFIPEEKVKEFPNTGTLALLHACKKAMTQGEKNQIVPLFANVFQTSFQGILAPRLSDELFLGIAPENRSDLSPLLMLHQGAALIRSLFFQEEGDTISFLPILPPEFHSGRFLMGDEIAFEWSKKLIKKIILKSRSDREVRLKLQKPIQSFRVRYSLKDRGKKIFKDQPILLKADQMIYCDRFEK